jgi:hypothetical protein
MLIQVGALCGILACMVDATASTVLGNRIPDYDHLRSPLSQLGIRSSPVAHEIAFWWVMMGILIILFGLSIYLAFPEKKGKAMVAAILVILYGMGEGLGSSLFPADQAGMALSATGIFHILIGGIGVLGLAFFPLVMQDLLSGIRKFSLIIFILGLLGVLLFLSSRFFKDPHNIIAEYRGLSQRYFITIYYIYILVIAFRLFLMGNAD